MTAVRTEIEYYDDMAKVRIVEFERSIMEDGNYHGLYQEFYPSGRKKYRGTYVQGKLHGLVQEWDDAGKLVYEAVYDNGTTRGTVYDIAPRPARKAKA